MLAWQVPYLGWRHFPAKLSEFEISRFFTFEPQFIEPFDLAIKTHCDSP